MNRQPIPPNELESTSNWQSAWSRGLSAIATYGDLRPSTAEALLSVSRLIARDQALARLASLLDPSGMASRWARAGKIADALAVFEASVAWRAIKAGGHPRSTFEAACTAVLRHPGPRTQRRLFDVLTDA